jgi:hypothetical protein
LAHVGVDVQIHDLFRGRLEREGHLIAGSRVIPENQVHDAALGIQ